MREGCTSHQPLAGEEGETYDSPPGLLQVAGEEGQSCPLPESVSASRKKHVLEGQPSLEVRLALLLVVLECTPRSVSCCLHLFQWALPRRFAAPRLLQRLVSEG